MSAFNTHVHRLRSFRSRCFLASLLACLFAFGLVSLGAAAGLDLVIVPDESPAAADSGSTEGAGKGGAPCLPETGAGAPYANGAGERAARSLERQKEAALAVMDPGMEEERRLMMEVVQVMDREAAAQWMASFICAKPLSCPLQQQGAWIEGILDGVDRNRLPVCKEILGLVASIISIESSFRVDPLAVDPSRGENIARLVDRLEHEVMEKYGPLMAVPPVPQMYEAYKAKYYKPLVGCRTEGEIEAVARNIAEDLKKDAEKLPAFVKSVVDKELDRVTHVVRTKGSMQLNYQRATEVLRARGERFTDQELTDYMYTLHGGIDAGIAALAPMFVQYAARYGKPGDLSWLFFVGMDYHYGPFSSRNMMEQIRIRDLSGHKIAIDGDFLHYDEKGRPACRESETMKATLSLFPDLPRSAILNSFLLEKDPHYAYTDLHRSIDAAHLQRFGETPFAVIGDLWMGQAALVKHGSMWKTRSYLKKLDRFLNAIPWDQ
jgi:hypothetical protein